jgi:hypothetical protein
VLATASQCHIFSTSNLNTPHIFDLQQPLQLLLQCERSMLLVDAAAGMQVCAARRRGSRARNGLYGACSAAVMAKPGQTFCRQRACRPRW